MFPPESAPVSRNGGIPQRPSGGQVVGAIGLGGNHLKYLENDLAGCFRGISKKNCIQQKRAAFLKSEILLTAI